MNKPNIYTYLVNVNPNLYRVITKYPDGSEFSKVLDEIAYAKMKKSFESGLTHANFPSDRMESIRTEVSKISAIYEMLETTDEVDENNPAFDFLCKVTEELYNCLCSLKELTTDNSSGSTPGVI